MSLTSSGTGTAGDMRPAKRSRKYGILNCTVYMGFHLVLFFTYLCSVNDCSMDSHPFFFNLQVYFADDAQ